jgi:hypothetical protein
MNCARTRTAWLVALALTAAAVAQTPTNAPTSTVGMPARIESLILPGTELEAAPAPQHTPIVLRIVSALPHGSLWRYELEFTGLVPGEHDLRPYLRRKDGGATTDLPPIAVAITPVLPKGQIEPAPLAPAPLPRVGGYTIWATLAIIAWVVGLVAILFVGRRRRLAAAAAIRPITLADRLRPLVEDAVGNRLGAERRAELEGLLLAWWRERLDLQQRTASEAIAALRSHAEAGELLRQLDAWLHEPPGRARQVDVAALLRPYQQPLAPPVADGVA